MKGWIKLYRKFLSWRFYRDVPCKVLFLHFLLTAAYQKDNINGLDCGFLISSLRQLAFETGLTLQQTRTALEKLEKAGCIKKTITKKCTLISVVNWNFYQGFDFAYRNDFTVDSVSLAVSEHSTEFNKATDKQGLSVALEKAIADDRLSELDKNMFLELYRERVEFF